MRYWPVVALVVLVGAACGSTPEPSVVDQAGLVQDWTYLDPNSGAMAEVLEQRVPPGHVPESPGVLGARTPDARDLVVVWSTAPCRTGPKLTVEASSSGVELLVDAGPTASEIGVGCPSALVAHGIRLDLSEELGDREVQLTVVHPEQPDETWSSEQPPATMPPLPAGPEPAVRLELPDVEIAISDQELVNDPERACPLTRALPDHIDEQGALGPYETSERALRAMWGAADGLPQSGWTPVRPRFEHATYWYVLDDRGQVVAEVTTMETRDGWYAVSASHCGASDGQ